MSHPHLALVHRLEFPYTPISVAEKLADHHAILQGYMDTYITRNYSDQTISSTWLFLKGWFKGFSVLDESHPEGRRQLLIWEAMEPVHGRKRIVEFSKGLIMSELKPGTVTKYLGELRRLFEYVLQWPYISKSNEVQSIVAKYGRIEQPVLEYDYPVHILDHEEEGFVLTGKRLTEFYEFVRLQYRVGNQKQITASRNYTMIVVAGETGLRASEIQFLDALGIHRDIFYEQNCLQTRFGKGVKGSGKQVRKTVLTPFAKNTLQFYENRIRPKFTNSESNPALFLTETGTRISYSEMWYSMNTIVQQAREAGLDLPVKVSWHSFRKSFATNFMEQRPDQVWNLMNLMGHRNPATLHRYVKHSKSYYQQIIDHTIGEYIPFLSEAT